jgi:CubicO group peptidase (beta-lactamase class C family)
MSTTPSVQGSVSPGYERVRDAFADNFQRRHELGGACGVCRFGRPVVDLWGGVRCRDTGEPWRANTMAIVYSATKGLAAMTLALAHSRGWLDYEAPVAGYWPEFAQRGKARITVRQLLAHQAGLYALDTPLDRALVTDLDRLADVLARQAPAWEPWTRQGYHAITLGFYQSELLRRIDPLHRSLGRFFQDEIATPLGLDPSSGCRSRSPTRGWRRWSGRRGWSCATRRCGSRSRPSTGSRRSCARSEGRSCRTIRSTSTRATSRFHRAARSVRREPSPGRTGCSPPAGANWVFDGRRSICSPHRPCRPPAGSTTKC